MGFRSSPATKPVLRPMSEDNWLKQKTPTKDTSLMPCTPDRGRRVTIADGRDEYSSDSDFGSDLIDQESRHWPLDKEKVLMGPYDYMESHPGKDIRSQLIAAFNTWLDVPKASLDVITRVVGMLHTASLL